MRSWIAFPLLATGCLSLPPFEPDGGVTYREAAGGATAAGPGFALHFAGGDGFHFPDALELDGKDVLGHAPASGCFEENEAGMLISPTPRISASGEADLVTSALSPVLRGPAVVQVKTEWSISLACNRERAPGGTSTFTVSPDGRIVRHDLISDTSASPVSAGLCECGPSAGAFSISTFWTVARELFTGLYAPGEGSDKLALPGAAEVGPSNQDLSCIDGGALQLAFAWSDVSGSVVRGHDAVIGFGRDLVVGASMLDAFSLENSAAVVLERGGCDAALARATAYLEPPPLRVNGEDVVASKRDGIYGGDPGDGAVPGVALASDRVELTGAMPGPFTVWLRFPRAVSSVRATLEGAKGAWYLPQRVDEHAWILWFRDPISVAQTIVVEPR